MVRIRRIDTVLVLSLLCLCGIIQIGASQASALTEKEELGKLIFNDTNLSSPDGQGCVSCHDPEFGFSDPDKDIPVSAGVLPLRVGPRNAPTVTYLATVPDFAQVDPNNPLAGFKGGQFLDGRAANLFEQAKLPFQNTLEMHNP